MAHVIGYKDKIYPKGTGGGGSGSNVEPNPQDTPTDTLETIGIDGTVYELAGGGGGGSSGVYVEDELYTATSTSFTGITVDWNWDDYDFYVFWVHDNPYTQRCGDTTILTKKQIKHLVDNSMDNVFYRYDNNYVIYTFGSNQLIATAKNGTHVIIQIIGVKTSGDYYSPIIYSTEEREIGVWTDNKPLYQKTYIGTWQLNGTSWSGTLVNIPNAELKNTECLGSDWQSMGVNGNIDSNGNLTLYNLRSTTLTAIAVTIQYTKTTDTAGSGSYNTLGVPTVHYTTDEQVIGTWVDGKPIYQKTFSATLSGDSASIDISNFNMERVIAFEGSYDIGVTQLALNEYINSSNVTYTHINTGLNPPYIDCKNYVSNNSTVYITVKYTKTTD